MLANLLNLVIRKKLRFVDVRKDKKEKKAKKKKIFIFGLSHVCVRSDVFVHGVCVHVVAVGSAMAEKRGKTQHKSKFTPMRGICSFAFRTSSAAFSSAWP
jgi:hypothetical protein